MQAEPKSRTTGARLAWAGLAALAALALLGGHRYFRAVTSRHERLQALAAELRRVEDGPGSQAAANGQLLAETREQLRALSARVPAGGEVGDFIKELSAALADEGVARREILTLPTVSGRPFSRVPVSLRLECTFEQAFKVLKRIENGPRLTRVDRLSVTGAGNDQSKPLRVEVEVSAFTRGVEEAAWAALE